jgi:hypothetical protein
MATEHSRPMDHGTAGQPTIADPASSAPRRHSLGAGVTTGLLISGTAFASYPLLRPWSPEVGIEGALAFASPLWTLSHALGMVGFAALAFALRTAAAASAAEPTRQPVGRRLRAAETWAWIAVSLLLPYYGAEAFGLNAIGGFVTTSGETAALGIADAFRYAPLPLATFTLGLAALAVLGGKLAHALWQAGPLARTGGILSAAALATYLPQFFGTPGLRIAHGLTLGAGLLIIAVSSMRHTRQNQE